MKPYVYRAEEIATGRYYFGYRCANKKPANEDLGHKYFTSCKEIKQNTGAFTYEVLSEYDTANDAYLTEQNLIWACWNDPLLINKACQRPDGKMWKTEKGRPSKLKGKKQSPEWVANRAKALKGYGKGRKEKPWTEERRAKIKAVWDRKNAEAGRANRWSPAEAWRKKHHVNS